MNEAQVNFRVGVNAVKTGQLYLGDAADLLVQLALDSDHVASDVGRQPFE